MKDECMYDDPVEELYNEYDTMNIVYAVDALDEVRRMFSDNGIRPPQIRDTLLELHRLAHQIINEGHPLDVEKKRGICALKEDIEMDIVAVMEKLEQIREAIRPLEKLYPAEDEIW